MTNLTGSVTSAGGSGGSTNWSNEDAKNTPRSFNVDQDARSQQGGEYPNYWSHKTRSGHNFIMDDTSGNETVTIQHRSGTAIQMRADGGMLITTHNGKYEVVLGEERVTISGASDITVKGDTSLRCYGDYNVTVHKDYNLTVLGNFNMTAKNHNRHIRGTLDTEAKIENKRVEGPITIGTQASYAVTSKADMSMVTTKGKMQHVAASGDVGFHAKGKNSKFVLEAANKMYQSAANELHETYGISSGLGAGASHKYGVAVAGNPTVRRISSKTGMEEIVTQRVLHKVEGEVQHMFNDKFTQSIGSDHTHDVGGHHKKRVNGTSSETVTTGNKITTVAQGSIQHTATTGSIDMRAPTGTATFAGGTTNINSITGVLNMAAAAGGVNIESIAGLLNLNGGIISQIASALGLSLPFNISLTSPTQADTPPQLQGTKADQPQEEPDATGEIDSWV